MNPLGHWDIFLQNPRIAFRPIDRETHVVYSIPCGDCEKVYLGQTNQESLPLTIVMVNSFVWKSGI